VKHLCTLILLGAVAVFAWVGYSIYRIDDALGRDDLTALAEYVDLEAVRAQFEEQLEHRMQGSAGSPRPGSAMEWLQRNLQQLGNSAIDQTVDMKWVQERLKAAAIRASDRPTPYFISGIRFAFFESYDRFLIRLGDLGEDPTHIRLEVRDKLWRITGIYD